MYLQHVLRRVLTWPGLSSSAKVGEIKLKELRQKALNALGELFRLQDFHTVVLKCAGPISILQLCIDHYINAVTTKAALASSSDDQTSKLSHGEQDKSNGDDPESDSPDKVPPDSSAGSSLAPLVNIPILTALFSAIIWYRV